jgi:hypothetical protein
MKNIALRVVYGALTLSLLIFCGCPQATDPKKPEEDKWKELLMPDGTKRLWNGTQKYNDSNERAYYTFYPDYKVGINFVNDNESCPADFHNSMYGNGSFDGTTAIFDNGTNKLTITKVQDIVYEDEIKQIISIYNPRFDSPERPDLSYSNTITYFSFRPK